MIEQHDSARDNQWNKLLTRCHGEEVRPNLIFKAKLLDELKRKTAENKETTSASETEPQSEAQSEERNWSKLLTHAYVPCTPRPFFKDMLLSQMAAKQAEIAVPAAEDEVDTVLKTMLSQYQPVVPRREFQTRLLGNLKERQRSTVIMRKASRRRTLFLSGLSSLAAAAVVLFVVWVMPTATQDSRPAPAGQNMAVAQTAPAPMPAAQTAPAAPRSDRMLASATLPASAAIPAAATAGLALASLSNYRVEDVFKHSPLPSTMRGVGMEINRGDGWQDMDETMLANVTPGIMLRPKMQDGPSGLGFGDGSTIHMQPDSVIQTTPRGIAVKQGSLTVNVPANSDSRFYLHFPERDVAVEPGTMLAVAVPAPDLYADGGAPAPVVKVLDGGMAVAKGKGGSGVLLANQVYQLDNYITPDLPGRPLCSSECQELQSNFMQPVNPMPMPQYSPTQLVSAGAVTDKRLTPIRVGYTKKGTRWQSNSYNGQPTVKIPYLSDEYFALANSRRDLSLPLSLGSEVVFDGGDGNFYEIYK